MDRKTFLLGIVMAFVSIPDTYSRGLGSSDESGWEKYGEEDEIVLFKKEIPNSSVIAFRGYTIIDAPMAKVAEVLDHSSRRKEWVASVVDAYTIKRIGPLFRWEYNQTKGSLFFQNRDFVFTAKSELNRKKKEMWIRLKSEEYPDLPPKEGIQRGELLGSAYFLKEVKGGSSTFVQVEISVDPKGNIPKWLVNMVQRNWPLNTLKGIKNQVKKPDVHEYELLKRYMNSKEGPDILNSETLKGSSLERWF